MAKDITNDESVLGFRNKLREMTTKHLQLSNKYNAELDDLLEEIVNLKHNFREQFDFKFKRGKTCKYVDKIANVISECEVNGLDLTPDYINVRVVEKADHYVSHWVQVNYDGSPTNKNIYLTE